MRDIELRTDLLAPENDRAGAEVKSGVGEGRLAKVVVITSGKGGVGKTTSAAAFATGLALRGHKTVVIDFDVGLRNLDLVMGCERRVVFDFINVINGDANLSQALIRDKRIENLYIFPTSQTRDKDSLKREGVDNRRAGDPRPTEPGGPRL